MNQLVKIGTGQLTKIGDCVCPESIVTYNCIVVGPGFTIWQGSTFECSTQENRILLRHNSFRGGAFGLCNGGAIVGSSISVSEDNAYTSQLNITVSSNVIGRTVECAYSPNGITVTPVDSATIDLTG